LPDKHGDSTSAAKERGLIGAYVPEARLGIGTWITFYNDERKHQALGYRTPREVFAAATACAYMDNAKALTAYAQAQQPQPAERDSNHQRKMVASTIELLAT
jgi:putative transposase